MTVFLASKSPRRRHLLGQAGIDFEVVDVDAEEDGGGSLPPEETAVANAARKALAGLRKASVGDRDVVIGADTIVVYNRKIFGKPKDRQDAAYMLTELSGKEHLVITGVAVAQKNNLWTDFAATRVTFRHLSPAEIEKYVMTGEPLDKAGAYGIQEKGLLLVEYINGCYANVVGLPLVTLLRLFDRAGVCV